MPASKPAPRPRYVDGFVLPLRKSKVEDYKKMARLAAKVWTEHGAVEYRECIGEDLGANMGMPFPQLTGLKRGETVVFAWIGYKSRAHRDRVNKKVMADPRIAAMCGKSMPFDVSRMSYGGFEVAVSA